MNWADIFSFRALDDEPKPFLEHIEDLRKMVIKMVIVLAVMTAGSLVFQVQLMAIIQAPLHTVDPEGKSLINFGVAEPLTIAIQLALYAGVILSFPFLVFFLAEFVLPALTVAERRMLYPAAAVSLGLFLGGVTFAYYFVLPPTLAYFFDYSHALNWNPQWSVGEYFSFATQFVISFGLAFELPLVILVLLKLGFVDLAILRRTRAFALVIIFVFAAIITPTSDILTLVLMGGPMYLLYEACILIAWFVERKARKARRQFEVEKVTRE